MLHLSTTVLALISGGALVPLVTGFLTKVQARAWVVSMVMAVLSIVTGTAAAAIGNGGNFLWSPVVGSVLLTTATAVVAHFFPGVVTRLKAKTKRFGLS